MAYPMNTRIPKGPEQGEVASVAPVLGEKKIKTFNSSRLKGLITLIIVLVIVGGGIYLIASYTGIGNGLIPGRGVFAGEWQGVFLDNGQVYFGKVAKMNNDFVFLKDIYYLQVVTLQDTLGQPSDVQTQPEQRLTLIKLGNEIHGPQDEMIINRSHVVLIEDLKDDSRVVTAINDYLKGGNAQPTVQPAQ